MVEWKKLGEIAKVQKTKNKKHVTENAYSITQAGLIPTKNFFKEKTHVTSSDTSGYYIVERDWFVYSPSRIDVGSISYLKDEGPVIVSPIDVVFSIDKTICLPSYLLNYFFTYEGKKALLKNREGVEGMGRRNLPFDAIKTMPIPIPSLSEQSRIVSILDTFTASIENLKAQIVERRKQYEYQRDQLLDLEGKEGVEMKKLGEVGELIRGNGIQKNDFVEEGYGCIHYGQIHARYGFSAKETISKIEESLYKKCKKAKTGDVILATTSEDAEGVAKPFVWLGEYEVAVSGDAFIYHHNQIGKFMGYQFLTRKFMQFKVKYATGAKVVRISGENMAKFEIALPSLSEQSRIVSILDTFEQSIANLEAQLELRQKQYEYYRNQLLTFE